MYNFTSLFRNTYCYPYRDISRDTHMVHNSMTLRNINDKVTDIQTRIERLSHESWEATESSASTDIKNDYMDILQRMEDIKKILDAQALQQKRYYQGSNSQLSALCLYQQNTINWQGCIIASWQMWWDEYTHQQSLKERDDKVSHQSVQAVLPNDTDWDLCEI